ncbi:MAG: tyrosine-type recombinase/integrase, partial [Methyloligellaceae bacterium]
MGRKAQNVLPANDQRIRKVVREARGKPQREWRIEGSNLLVLLTQPSGNASYYVYYTNRHGQRRKLKLGPHSSISLHEARSRSIEALGAIERGEDPASDKAALKEAITFGELLEKFLAENSDIKDSTRKVYGYSLRKDALPVIGSLPALEVTSDHIVEICKRIEATGASTQPDRTKAAIGGVYRWGQKQRLVKTNPATGIGRRKRNIPRNRTPSDAELASLWVGIEEGAQLSIPMQFIIKLAILTGQRRSEICGARRSELRLDEEHSKWVIPGD